MSLEFTKLIACIEAELAAEYVPEAIAWADKLHEYAWSRALDRFDKALSVAMSRGDYALAKVEGEFYKATILDLLRKFKSAKNLEDTESFLSALSVT